MASSRHRYACYSAKFLAKRVRPVHPVIHMQYKMTTNPLIIKPSGVKLTGYVLVKLSAKWASVNWTIHKLDYLAASSAWFSSESVAAANGSDRPDWFILKLREVAGDDPVAKHVSWNVSARWGHIKGLTEAAANRVAFYILETWNKQIAVHGGEIINLPAAASAS